MLPVLAYRNENGETVPYDGQKGIDLDSNLFWIWPDTRAMAMGLINGIRRSGPVLKEGDVEDLFSRTPAIATEVKKAIKQIKEALVKILNRQTARRAPGYKAVVERYSRLLREKQAELDEMRAAVRLAQEGMDQLLLERDKELRVLDPNFKTSRESLEDQLKNFGLDSMPLAAADAQRPARSRAPGAAEQPKSILDSFLDDDE